jgi:hypothetical protein
LVTTKTPIRTRPMRAERLVALRSTMPVQLVTLRHSVPELWADGMPLPEEAAVSAGTGAATPPATTAGTQTTTPKVDSAARRAVETAAGKGGDAR